MSEYIDGFVLPVPRDHINEYRRIVQAVAKIWKEHGAREYREYIGDDLSLEGTRSFNDAVAAREGDLIIFGWVVFKSREERDLANKKVAADPRVTKIVDSSDSGFDASRMVYGGFRAFVPSSDDDI